MKRAASDSGVFRFGFVTITADSIGLEITPALHQRAMAQGKSWSNRLESPFCCVTLRR